MEPKVRVKKVGIVAAIVAAVVGAVLAVLSTEAPKF